MTRLAACLACLLLLSVVAKAQQVDPETIEIGLSTDQIAITADFTGADLTIFGALDNADPLVARQGRYDIIVVLQGPAVPTVVRRKERLFGMWINRHSLAFESVPISYSLATSRAIQDIADDESFRRLSLGVDYIHLKPRENSDITLVGDFTEALRNRKEKSGLYNERIGGVQFLSQNLFRASLSLPPNVPVGTHRARAFLFKNGVFLKETSAPLSILKAGLEDTIYRSAHDHSFMYGIGAVMLAMLTGWLGQAIFRKD
ncbi:MAG: TIGR02186 family protein [Rhizobiaceae bacterium]